MSDPNSLPASAVQRSKLHGRAFYESIGSPKMIMAPMVDQSEFAWRMLSRSYLKPEDRKHLLCYSPMLHSRLFNETEKFRNHNFQPAKNGFADKPMPVGQKLDPKNVYLDGREDVDRPLTVQFCANDPTELLNAAKWVQAHCDAVDLNLGCPQGIARKGKYGAFLQEDVDLICSMISKVHKELDIPITAKIRILETREKTLEYAKRVVNAGASILTVHGRQRHMKGHLSGLADWDVIRYIRDSLPKEVVMFANGNVLQHEDIAKCLEATGVDGVMSAEGNLANPAIFAEPPPVGQEGRIYWRGRDGKGGFRVDAAFRRYLDIIHEHVLQKPAPARKPLFLPSDDKMSEAGQDKALGAADQPEDKTMPAESTADDDQRPRKRRKGNKPKLALDFPISANISGMQAHLFHMLRHLVSQHTHIRDALAHCPKGDIAAFENVLSLVEEVTKQGLLEYEKDPSKFEDPSDADSIVKGAEEPKIDDHESSIATVKACKRPFWVLQPYVRPLPKEALEKGALQLSKKELKKLEEQKLAAEASTTNSDGTGDMKSTREKINEDDGMPRDQIPKEAMVAG